MSMWAWLRRILSEPPAAAPRRVAKRQQPIALVLFLRQRRELNVAHLAGLAADALGGRFTTEEGVATDRSITGEAPSFTLKLDRHHFLVNCFGQPYMDDPQEAAETISELRLRKAVRDHSAW